MQIKDKVAVVTGGCSGLGKSVVTDLLAQNAKVVVFDVNADAGQQLLAEFDNDSLDFKVVDVTSETSVQGAIDEILQHQGRVDICVNCAGIAPAKKVVDRELNPMPLADFAKVIDVNLIGSFNVAKAAAAAMCKNEADPETQERGVIINTASIAGYEGQIGQSAYAASKGGIIATSLPMARELARYGIRVNAVAPGTMGTPMLLAMPDNVQEALVSNIQFPKRLGYPAEFGFLVRHIVENPYINGETLRLDGALRMPPK